MLKNTNMYKYKDPGQNKSDLFSAKFSILFHFTVNHLTIGW